MAYDCFCWDYDNLVEGNLFANKNNYAYIAFIRDALQGRFKYQTLAVKKTLGCIVQSKLFNGVNCKVLHNAHQSQVSDTNR